MPLTDVAVKNAKPNSKPYKLTDGNGLYLLVQPTGSRLWRFKYRYGGKEKVLALGPYGDVTLKDARNKRDAARKLLLDGVDPALERKAEKVRQSAAADDSFESVAREWWKSWSTARTPKHAVQVLRRMEADIFPEIGAMRVADIKAPMVLALAKKIEKRGALDIARRSFQMVGQVFRYAAGHGLIEHIPTASVRPGDVLKPKVQRNLARSPIGTTLCRRLLVAARFIVCAARCRKAPDHWGSLVIRTSSDLWLILRSRLLPLRLNEWW